MSTLAERLQECMKSTGVTQAEIARACGIKPPSVADWISGKTKNLKGKNLVATARLLHVSDAWLADGIGPKARSSDLWPFTAPFSDYVALDDEKKRALNDLVVAFLAGAAPRKSSRTADEKAA